jgi:hypothetical protein
MYEFDFISAEASGDALFQVWGIDQRELAIVTPQRQHQRQVMVAVQGTIPTLTFLATWLMSLSLSSGYLG